MSKLNNTKNNRHIAMPSTHKRERAAPADADGDFVVTDATGKLWASGLSKKDAQRKANALSASQQCRTTKVMSEADYKAFVPTSTPSTPAPTKKPLPPFSVMAGAQAAAAQAAKEANERAEQKAAARAKLDQAEQTAKANLAALEEPEESVDDLIGEVGDMSDAELADAAGAMGDDVPPGVGG